MRVEPLGDAKAECRPPLWTGGVEREVLWSAGAGGVAPGVRDDGGRDAPQWLRRLGDRQVRADGHQGSRARPGAAPLLPRGAVAQGGSHVDQV